MTPEDLRAGVQAGILNEEQAAALNVLAEARAGQRLAMPAEDEPFEFFRGFAEIFITIGMLILLGGIISFLTLAGGEMILLYLPLICAAIAWWWATYFTLKRRMNLPSMVLAVTFGMGIMISGYAMSLDLKDFPSRIDLLWPLAAATLAMGVWYRRFRLPFAAFVLGLFALATLYVATASFASLQGLIYRSNVDMIDSFFDLKGSPVFATATLGFGIAAFVAAMWFDTRDPHRLGRHAATAFWLHMLAAPALVNTVALTLYNSGGHGGMVLLIIALVVIAALALIIDRRSFLSAAIAYIAAVFIWIIGDDGSITSWAVMLMVLGGLITAMGTWWVQLRAALMRLLPHFPGKDRLPPYKA